jgi:hypothetical protein
MSEITQRSLLRHSSAHSHPHPHSHAADGHSHDADGEVRPTSSEVRPAGPSRGVCVDVGEGVGALVLYADSDREWLEPQIHPIEDPDCRQHVWVLERLVASGSVYAAVFGSLPEGRYGVCSPDGPMAQVVEIVGGEVTEARWA